jgi:hypothetical protein
MNWEKKNPSGVRQKEICECGVEEGRLHIYWCRQECCPFCGERFISCDCCYKLLNLIDKDKYDYSTAYLPPEIFENGLTEKQTEQWKDLLNQKGRIPFIIYPQLCAKCGKQWPEFFMVPDEEWSRYIQPDKQGDIICRECYDFIKKAIDSAKEKYNSA